MKQLFAYNRFNEEVADGLVETAYALTQAYIDGKQTSADYIDANNDFNEKFMKFCVESMPNTTYTGLDQIKNPMVHKNMFFLQTFDTIMAQILTPVIPTVASAGYEQLYEVFQVGFGVA